MPTTCEYDDRPIFEDGMCEDCYSEAESDLTCDHCGDRATVKQGRVNAVYECGHCGAWWI